MAGRTSIPWWAKIGLKIVLSRLPLDYGVWRRVGLFRHGRMDQASYALQVFRTHFSRCWAEQPPDGYACLELGPGDTLFSALIARSFGAAATYLVDAGPYAIEDPQPYRDLAQHLTAQGLHCPPGIDRAASIADVLGACGATYLTRGLASLASVPTASIDWVWSQAVLEHIRKAEFLPYMKELRRILKPHGKASHRIDLRDHLASALNNLRFDERTWERDWLAASGFYTNRIRFSQMRELFRKAGFAVDVVHVDRWTTLPTRRQAMAAPFSTMADDELLVQGFDVLLTAP